MRTCGVTKKTLCAVAGTRFIIPKIATIPWTKHWHNLAQT